MFLRNALAVAVVATAMVSAHADTLTLDTANSSGGTYRYNYTTGSNGSAISYYTAIGFTFTGLSGVTGASTAVPSLFTVSFTSTSVSFGTQSGSGVRGAITDLFTITSSVLTLGNVQYSIPTSPAQTGTVLGPVAAAAVTPEPSSLLLLGTGVLGAVGAARRRFV